MSLTLSGAGVVSGIADAGLPDVIADGIFIKNGKCVQ